MFAGRRPGHPPISGVEGACASRISIGHLTESAGPYRQRNLGDRVRMPVSLRAVAPVSRESDVVPASAVLVRVLDVCSSSHGIGE